MAESVGHGTRVAAQPVSPAEADRSDPDRRFAFVEPGEREQLPRIQPKTPETQRPDGRGAPGAPGPGAIPNQPGQLNPGNTGAPGRPGSGYSLDTLQANAQFLNNLLYLGEATGSTPRGTFTVELDHDTGKTQIDFHGDGKGPQPYLDFDALVRDLHVGRYEGSGLPSRMANDYPELNTYLESGGRLSAVEDDPGAAGSNQPDRADWERIGDPDRAWEQFKTQYPDLADMMTGLTEAERKAVLEMMKKGFVLSEALAKIRDGALDSGGGMIPPDVRDRLAVAGGFEEPDDTTRQLLQQHFGANNAEQVLQVAREHNIHPKVLAEALVETKQRANQLEQGLDKLQAHERLQREHAAPRPGIEQQIETARETLADDVRESQGQPLVSASAPAERHVSIEQVVGSAYDVTFDPEYASIREQVEQVLQRAEEKGLLPESYRVTLVKDGFRGIENDREGGRSDHAGNILINADIVRSPDTAPSRSANRVVGHELGHVFLREAANDIQVRKVTDFGQIVQGRRETIREFSPYIAELVEQNSDQLRTLAPQEQRIQASAQLMSEFAAELAASAMMEEPVSQDIHELADEYLPQAYMDKVGPNLDVRNEASGS